MTRKSQSTHRWTQGISARDQQQSRPVFFFDGNFRTWDQVERMVLLNTAFAAMVAGSVRDLAAQVAVVRATIAAVEDPVQAPPPLVAPPREPFRLTSAMLRA